MNNINILKDLALFQAKCISNECTIGNYLIDKYDLQGINVSSCGGFYVGNYSTELIKQDDIHPQKKIDELITCTLIKELAIIEDLMVKKLITIGDFGFIDHAMADVNIPNIRPSNIIYLTKDIQSHTKTLLTIYSVN